LDKARFFTRRSLYENGFGVNIESDSAVADAKSGPLTLPAVIGYVDDSLREDANNISETRSGITYISLGRFNAVNIWFGIIVFRDMYPSLKQEQMTAYGESGAHYKSTRRHPLNPEDAF
jgi:hypothetical protein